jgi:hypothetical protein
MRFEFHYYSLIQSIGSDGRACAALSLHCMEQDQLFGEADKSMEQTISVARAHTALA